MVSEAAGPDDAPVQEPKQEAEQHVEAKEKAEPEHEAKPQEPDKEQQGAPQVRLLTKLTGAYSQRELHFVQQEASGSLRFEYIKNDGQHKNLIWLTHLKNIYSRQLPNMPREYIVRLVFERRHRSVGIVTPENMCIGGITYRTFPDGPCDMLGEIAFCAVSATHQVKGFGTRLMNWTKEHARVNDRLTHFLTYADNNAVGYFAKQGFTKDITLSKDVWGGYIKDYDGGTLMEFVIHPRICYSAIPETVASQRRELETFLHGVSNSNVVHPPLNTPGQPFKPRTWQQIPGVKEAGYRGPAMPSYQLTVDGSLVEPVAGNLTRFMLDLLNRVRAHDHAWPFQEPVDKNDAPDYYDVVTDPMDLSTMRKRLDAGRYVTLELFLAELQRIWDNAKVYNCEDTIYYKFANQLQEFVAQHVHAHVHKSEAAS